MHERRLARMTANPPSTQSLLGDVDPAHLLSMHHHVVELIPQTGKKNYHRVCLALNIEVTIQRQDQDQRPRSAQAWID